MIFHVALETNWRYRTANWDAVLLLYATFGASTLLAARSRKAVAP